MAAALDQAVFDQLFHSARTFNHFSARGVEDDVIRKLYDLLKWGPTAFNSQPGRYVFLRSEEAKARLAPALSSSNREKTVTAPLNVIIAYDSHFHHQLPRLTTSPNAKELFDSVPGLIEPTALRSSSLQAAYLILAARALGLDVGVITGFKPEQVNKEFFPDGQYKVNMIVNLGYQGNLDTVKPRAYRFSFEEVAQLL